MWAIAKKEIKTYFLSPIGYVFIGLFLIMCSIFFYLDVITYGTTNFEYMFYSAATILTFIIPILTMKMFAEERKTGTEQILFTSPRSITSIALGKLLGAAIIILITEAFTLVYYFILMTFGTPHITTALITLLGYFLLAMTYISFGMLASSLTENQIIAGVITIAFFIITWFMPNFITGTENFSFINVFCNTFPTGAVSVSSIVLFLSSIVMFTLLTIVVLQRKKSIK
ncbi:MAG: ABC transporter permease [Clostridia bacterium]